MGGDFDNAHAFIFGMHKMLVHFMFLSFICCFVRFGVLFCELNTIL